MKDVDKVWGAMATCKAKSLVHDQIQKKDEHYKPLAIG